MIPKTSNTYHIQWLAASSHSQLHTNWNCRCLPCSSLGGQSGGRLYLGGILLLGSFLLCGLLLDILLLGSSSILLDPRWLGLCSLGLTIRLRFCFLSSKEGRLQGGLPDSLWSSWKNLRGLDITLHRPRLFAPALYNPAFLHLWSAPSLACTPATLLWSAFAGFARTAIAAFVWFALVGFVWIALAGLVCNFVLDCLVLSFLGHFAWPLCCRFRSCLGSCLLCLGSWLQSAPCTLLGHSALGVQRRLVVNFRCRFGLCHGGTRTRHSNSARYQQNFSQ